MSDIDDLSFNIFRLKIQVDPSEANNIAKGEIDHHEQFLFFPQCFQPQVNIKLYGNLPIWFQSRLLHICCILEMVKHTSRAWRETVVTKNLF